ncbi:MAG: hypothetical protein V7640_2218 [Betaproteobacteria bacterium]|jgi:uncharacterized protein (DUF302 family)
MSIRISKIIRATCFSLCLVASTSALAQEVDTDGLVKTKSAYSVEDTVARIKQDIASKNIMYFMTVDQSSLAKASGINLRPSVLLIFGNPPLGTQFLTSNPFSGLDWPVRLLVLQDENGDVWTAYTDFGWIARRHGITDREQQFKMASSVIESITSSVRAK